MHKYQQNYNKLILTTIFIMSASDLGNFEGLKPKRSMSYNDLKKRRLLRSKSKTRLQKYQADFISKTQRKTPQTQCKSTISVTSKNQNIIQNCMNQVKNALSEIKQQSKNKSIKQIISKQFYTDRGQTSHPKNQLQKKINQKLSFYDKSDYIKQQKQVIKNIIMNKKSQRRLLRYSQIRQQVKKSKSKSNDKNDKEKSDGKRQKKDDDTTISLKKDHILKNRKNNPSSNSAKKIRANKFELVPQASYMTQKPTAKQPIKMGCQSKQKELSNPPLFKSSSRRKLKKSISHIIIKTKVDKIDKSLINFDSLNIKQELMISPQNLMPKKLDSAAKQSNREKKQEQPKLKQMQVVKDLKFLSEQQGLKINITNQSQTQNFINISGISSIQQKRNNSNLQSCLDIVQQLQNNQKAFFKTNEADYQNCSDASNILNLLAMPTTQLKIKLNGSKNGKRKHDLQKFKKVFPKNFFKS